MARDARPVWLAAGVRTAFVRVDGPFAERDALALSVPVVQAMAERVRGPRIHAADCAVCETHEGTIDRIECDLSLEGPLDAEQRARLLEIAGRCPVHRTLTSEIDLPIRLVPWHTISRPSGHGFHVLGGSGRAGNARIVRATLNRVFVESGFRPGPQLRPRPEERSMNVRSSALSLLVLVVAAADGVSAACTSPAAVALVRAEIEASCPCATATSHSAYTSCASGVASQAVTAGILPSGCRTSVVQCASNSTCGRAGAVTCCRTIASGKTSCSVKSGAGACRAPKGGSACVGAVSSCCDACTATGCAAPTTTTTVASSTTTVSTSTTTTTLVTLPCATPVVPLPSLVKVPLTISPGSADCGGPAFSTPPSAPFAGELDDASSTKLSDLGTDCLSVGGGSATLVPPAKVPDGATTVLAATGLTGTMAVLGPSSGTGPKDCTLGAGPGRHCVNGAPGTGGGACSADAQCGVPGSCALDANCFFGPPLPLGGPAAACVENVVLADMCGDVDLVGFATNVNSALSARVFLTGDAASPCPRCMSGKCTAGPNAGNGCQPVGTLATSLDCPPDPASFVGTITVVITPLSTEPQATSASSGLFCPGQNHPGAFGVPAVRRIATSGRRLSLLDPSLALAAPFCVPTTHGGAIDVISDLPGPGAVSISGQLDVSALLGLLLP